MTLRGSLIAAAFALLLALIIAPDCHAQVFRRPGETAARTSSACLGCHRDKAREFTSGGVVHAPVQKEECGACHRRHGIAPRLTLVSDTESLCLGCHPTVDKNVSNRHPMTSATGTNSCLSCHAPHVSAEKGLLRHGRQEACGGCHEGVTGHPAGQECMKCHQAHDTGSGNSKLLRASVTELCISCHKDSVRSTKHGQFDLSRVSCEICHSPHQDTGTVKSLLDASIHPPILDGGCGNCHLETPRHGEPHLAAPVKDLCVTCHSDLLPPDGAKGLHPPAQERNCLTCHFQHTSPQPRLLRKEQSALCRSCHSRIGTPTDSHVHSPFSSGDCSDCHNPHGSRIDHALRSEPEKLCAKCHAEKAAGATRPDAHPPQSECSACHKPHQSIQPYLLTDRPETLCLDCHTDLAEKRANGVAHRPLTDTGCVACHATHGSLTNAFLRIEVSDTARHAPGALCRTCHTLVDSGTVHRPVEENRCPACHDPHFSDQPALTREKLPELCLTCHEKIGTAIKARYPHSAVAQGLCKSCHEPHSAAEPHLLRRSRNDLCQSCHDDLYRRIDNAESGTAGTKAHPPAAENNCEICHDVHGSDNPGHLTNTIGSVCSLCHSLTDADFVRRHGGRPMENVNCRGCHDPHAGGTNLVLKFEHGPFAARECSNCHDAAANGALIEAPPELCFVCHSDLKEALSSGKTHAPVKAGQCITCHTPHASDQPHLIRAPGICASCHATIKGDSGAVSRHRPVVENKCVSCHQPHNSKNEKLLRSEAGDLCLGCHSDFQVQIDSATVVHGPVAAKECTLCHNPHSSNQIKLLADAVPELCFTCHSSDDNSFRRAHQGMSGPKMRCTTCHNPHFGGKALLSPKLHNPVAKGLCGTCHLLEGDNPTGLRRPVSELCRTCHIQIGRTASEARVAHPPAAEGNCLACHDPHGTGEKANLIGPQVEVCGRCHAGKKEAALSSPFPHPPVTECSKCHLPHGGDVPRLLNKPGSIELCESCHPTQGEFVHPVGAKVISPIDGKMVTCLNCHTPHGGAHRALMSGPQQTICGTCHTPATNDAIRKNRRPH